MRASGVCAAASLLWFSGLSCGVTEWGASSDEHEAASPGTSSGGRSQGDDPRTAGESQHAGAPSDLGGTAAAGEGASSDVDATLIGAPLLFAPTSNELGVSAVLGSGSPGRLRARIRELGESDWQEPELPLVRAADLAEWRLPGLTAGTEYEYEIFEARTDRPDALLYAGRGVTQREPGDAFRFALISDSHIGSDLSFSNQGAGDLLGDIAAELAATTPDFVINLGDILDYHQFGFNLPPPNAAIARTAYLNYRTAFGAPLGQLAHFGVIGNWDGENGSFTAEEVARSREPRLLYLPTPRPGTYPEDASPAQDYYAFSWGDALFVILNVMSYTPTEHLLGSGNGTATDWTLGAEQLAWLEATLEETSAKWRFLFIHHTVGGAAGDPANSAYGRGGGLAAHVGEQAQVHDMMLKYGAQVFFYGHDHVFTDMVVDGVHYSTPGSAGAPWHFTSAETGYAEYWTESGWAEVQVSESKVDVTFLAQGGEELFTYSLE